jgi:hypothetical protein
MITPAPLPEGRTHPYGFGLGLGELRGRPTVGHGGGIFGFITDSMYVPSDDLFVAVFTNSDAAPVSPGVVTARLAALALGQPYQSFTATSPDMQALAPLFGVYRVGEGGVSRRFFSRGGKLYTRRDGGADLEVFAAGEGRFFYGLNSLTWFRIERGADGAPVMQMHQNGNDRAESAVRIGDIPADPAAASVDRAVLESYVGRYQTSGPMADIAIGEGGVLTIHLTGQPALPLRPTSTTEFLVEGVNARIVFHGEGGQVNRFVVHQGGRELEGRRIPR